MMPGTAAILSLFFLPVLCNGQNKINRVDIPKEQWPAIALINNVKYKNGDSYIHSSFTYAGTGFLIDNGKDTLAVTAKHVLWIARNKKTNTVQVNEELAEWRMSAKNNPGQYALIGKLLNEDSTEILEGPSSDITERDILIFTTSYLSPGIKPLRPRYSKVKKGEKVYFLSCAYEDKHCTVSEGIVHSKLGYDILIERTTDKNKGGASGSAVIDANGYLVGVLSSSTLAPKSDISVTVAISTEYLHDILTNKKDLNTSKKDYGELILETVLKQGTKRAIQQYYRLSKNPANYYIYNLRSANRNGLRETGEKLIEMKRFKEAVEILKLNVKENREFYANYNILAKAQLLAGNKKEAVKNYQLSVTKNNNKEDNGAFKELENLDSKKQWPRKHTE